MSASATTPNLGLPQWAAGDPIKDYVRDEFNAAFLAIDGVAGTFVPSIAFGGNAVGVTYNAAYHSGRYLKIGKLVMFTCLGVLTSKGSSTGDATITDLPYPIAAICALNVQLAAVTFADFQMAKGVTSGSGVSLLQVSNAGVVSGLTNVNFANNSDFLLSGSYFTT